MSVVIPAHNEARVLDRTLAALFAGSEPGELEVVVACNGCTDGTADVARAYGSRINTIEVPVASKAAALNAGDRAAQAFPRVYLDADIEVDIAALRAVRAALRSSAEGPLAAAPRARFETRHSSWPVRQYFDVWARLPYVGAGLLGTGFYAVSEAGRSRFAAFPDIVADDLFVQRLFEAHERVTVDGTFTVRPPRDIASLLRSKVRVYAGNRQYARAVAAGDVPVVAASTPRDAGTPGTRQALVTLARQPRWWPGLTVYLVIVAIAKARADVRIRRGHTARWDQDVTGRAS